MQAARIVVVCSVYTGNLLAAPVHNIPPGACRRWLDWITAWGFSLVKCTGVPCVQPGGSASQEGMEAAQVPIVKSRTARMVQPNAKETVQKGSLIQLLDGGSAVRAVSRLCVRLLCCLCKASYHG